MISSFSVGGLVDEDLWKYKSDTAYESKFCKLLQSSGSVMDALTFVVHVATPQPGFYDTFYGYGWRDFWICETEEQRVELKKINETQLMFADRVKIAQRHADKADSLLRQYLPQLSSDQVSVLIEMATFRESKRVMASKIESIRDKV